MIYYNDNITPAFRTWCVENYGPKTPTVLYYSNGTSSSFGVSTITWSEVGKASAYATNTSVIQAIGGTNCTTVSDYAFCYCTSLTTASFPSCTTIGPHAFAQCYSLTTASFPACTTIGSGAFVGCVIQSAQFLNVTTVYYTAFDVKPYGGCVSALTFSDQLQNIDPIAFRIYGSIYVPTSSIANLISTYNCDDVDGDTKGCNVDIYVDNVLYKTIHTACL